MNKLQDVPDAYKSLWHYTTGAGLRGIIESQTLWASSIHFLNDAEEFSGFFDRKFRHLVYEGVLQALDQGSKTEEGRALIARMGGSKSAESQLIQVLHQAVRTATLNLNAYVVSFCHTETGSNTEDGLLSQWRGYGFEGGYAIVFSAEGLNALLKQEQNNYIYAFGHWGNVDYHDYDETAQTKHPETQAWEQKVISAIAEKSLQSESGLANELFEPIMCLATRHKHRGFREEREVRISLLELGVTDIATAHEQGDKRLAKPVSYHVRNGMLVPYVALFERPDGVKASLPIEKIVVGPHPDKVKRKRSIEILLAQNNITAPVVVSDIPYIGR